MSRALKIIGLVALITLALSATVGGSLYLASQATKRTVRSAPCPTAARPTYQVIIKNSTVTPQHTNARRCDNLRITNLDRTNRLMAFGRHSDHTSYNGVESRVLGTGQSLEVQLSQTGSYVFHDHFEDRVQGTFTVRD